MKHGRPPAFGGSDGAYYSVDTLVTSREEDTDLERGYGGAIMFVQWSGDGAQPVSHVETDYLFQSDDRFQVKAELEKLTLQDLKDLLDRLVEQRGETPDW